MIEELEKACIRFVHFSKENELRSRVFSEKMGLESGWNCHISLLPDIDKNQYDFYFEFYEHRVFFFFSNNFYIRKIILNYYLKYYYLFFFCMGFFMVFNIR